MELIEIKANQLKTQANAVLYFLQRLDIEMLDLILDSDRTYQNFEKHIFIQKLGDALAEFIAAGDTFLNCYSGSCDCKTCNYKCPGYSFIGNNSGYYMDLIIEVKDGFVYDMCECAKFKTLENGVNKRTRIRIDNSPLPF